MTVIRSSSEVPAAAEQEADESIVLCDCCPNRRHVTMARIRDGKLIIIKRAHGQQHTVAIPLDSLAALVQSNELTAQ